MLTLNDMLASEKIEPRKVLVLRHRPTEPELNKVFLDYGALRQLGRITSETIRLGNQNRSSTCQTSAGSALMRAKF